MKLARKPLRPLSSPRDAFGVVVALITAFSAAGCSEGTPPSVPPLVQTPVEWLKVHAVPIRTFSMNSNDFGDLEPLRSAIGGARVVMLGEQTHGDGTTFLAKARLIEFLHQEMGFDVLVWESGISEVHGVSQYVKAGEDALTAARRGIFGVWTSSAQVLPTFDYVTKTQQTNRPMELAGMDNQIRGILGRDSLTTRLHAFASRIGSSAVHDSHWPTAIMTLAELAVTQHFNTKPTTIEQAALLRILGLVRADALAKASTDRDALFWAQALKSIDSFARMMWAAPAGQFRPEDNNVRDMQMADNLVWLANTYYANRKIIVWAASAHIARAVADLRGANGYAPYSTGWTVHMGTEAHKVLGSQMYSIGFIAASGSFGTPTTPQQQLPVVPPGSMEQHFLDAGLENAFLNLRGGSAGGEWLRDVYTGAFGYQALKGNWANVFDGVVFTRQMIPSTAAPR